MLSVKLYVKDQYHYNVVPRSITDADDQGSPAEVS